VATSAASTSPLSCADDPCEQDIAAGEDPVARLCSQQRIQSVFAKTRGLNRKAHPRAVGTLALQTEVRRDEREPSRALTPSLPRTAAPPPEATTTQPATCCTAITAPPRITGSSPLLARRCPARHNHRLSLSLTESISHDSREQDVPYRDA
jgi:hypothetical protein